MSHTDQAATARQAVSGLPSRSQQPFVQTLAESLVMDDIGPCPTAGGGVHDFVLKTTSELVREGCPDWRIHAILERATRSCGRDLKAGEIQDAINGARKFFGRKDAGPAVERLPKPMEMPQEECQAIRRRIIEASPVRSLAALQALGAPIPDNPLDILSRILPGNPLVLVKERVASAGTVIRLHEPGVDLRLYPSFCPNPALALTATRQEDGKTSPSIKENFPVRRHIIVESDCLDMDWDGKAAILGHIGKSLPLVAVTHSGGKSLHGIYAYDETRDHARLRLLIQSARVLGIDPKPLANAACTTRMPWAVRPESGNVQTPLFFTPNPTLFQ